MKKKWNKIVKEILKMDSDMSKLSDSELRHKTDEFKLRLKEGTSLDSLLPEAFAVVREAAFRVVGMKPYPVQIMGGIAIHEGNIAEMATGEGKTLVSTMPAYLNALVGKGVHIVTVNDYLAKRDAEWMGKIHEFLGLSVGYILNDYTPDRRKQAYNCDITYITNNELGFDYLRDNMAKKSTDIVQRGLHFAIIDEIDSILIDEARTPLIISGNESDASSLYIACDILARQMQKGKGDGKLKKIDAILGEDIVEDGDFYVDEKDKNVSLTVAGVEKVEDYFHIENFSAPEHLAIQKTIILALKANYLMFRDKDYVVKEQQVFIVDEFTGRIMKGRRFSDGLHQAIEAKERVVIQKENNTLATITLQNFFNKYDKKAGMTGTAKTEEKEFRDTYHMKVCPIPTNKPISRVDEPDSLYLTKKEKFHAIIEDIVKTHEKEQPVLVGTINIDTSEYLSRKLKEIGIKHQVLNINAINKALTGDSATKAASSTSAQNNTSSNNEISAIGSDSSNQKRSNNSDGTYTVTETSQDTKVENGVRITYETTIQKIYKKDGTLLKTKKIGPQVINKETLTAADSPDKSKIKSTLDKELARVSSRVEFDTKKANDVLTKLNAQRKSEGLSSLSMDTSSEAYKLACIRAADMAIYDYSSSTSPMYGTLNDMCNLWKISSSHPSENIWKAPSKTADEIHSRFQSNDGSRKIRMSNGYSNVGIAVIEKNGNTYIAEIYLS